MKTIVSRHRYLVLLAMLVTLHLVVLETPGALLGRVLWLCNVGLFLLWQPFVSGERRLSPLQIAVFLGGVLWLLLELEWGWLAAWVAFLAALVGGKVVMARGRRLRWFYLLAFAYLMFTLLVWVAPQIVVSDGHADPLFELTISVIATLGLLALTLSLPYGHAEPPAELFDFLASLLILLLLGVVLLGSTSLMGLKQLGYFDALTRSLFGLGGVLLLLSWAWNPRPGFGGVGVFLSGYLLRLGFPFDTWLRGLTELSETESDPADFLARALDQFRSLPWVTGGEWHYQDVSGRFGETGPHGATVAYGGVHLRLSTAYAWSAGLIWQASLLLKLVVELHRAKLRDQALNQLRYLQAVHETGARLTHDIKNLLQSLDSLCFAAEQADPSDGDALAQLFRRQLPTVSQRLRHTLDRLRNPVADDQGRVPLARWWGQLRQRYERDGIDFVADRAPAGIDVSPALFDSVADNLLINGLQKRQREPRVALRVSLACRDSRPMLRVEDTGSAIPDALAHALFDAPVESAAGLGIGLYHAARMAAASGYVLSLADNRSGAVAFELCPATAPAAASAAQANDTPVAP